MGQINLKRVLGFWGLVAFGVGDILGAGIYALVGKIAGVAGQWCWLAFLVSLIVAAMTALSYAELSTRIPKSGGEASYNAAAFGPAVGLFIGWMVLCSGIVSMATVGRALVGYLEAVLPVPGPLIIIGFSALICVVVWRGIQASSAMNIICTLIESSGLLIVIFVSIYYLCHVTAAHTAPVAVPATTLPWTAILQGGALAFFAFIGFEDMVNVAEEVTDPEQMLPRAILTALAIAGGIYILIAYLAVQVLTPAELQASSAPLLDVVHRAAPSIPTALFTGIAIFAIANTALLNCVMGSRLLYGMADQRMLPAVFARLHPTWRTPHIALLAVTACALVLALTGDLAFLAGTTSALLLIVFIAVNLSLVVLKRRSTTTPAFTVHSMIPLLGVALSALLLRYVSGQALMTAGCIMLLGGVVLCLRRSTAR